MSSDLGETPPGSGLNGLGLAQGLRCGESETGGPALGPCHYVLERSPWQPWEGMVTSYFLQVRPPRPSTRVGGSTGPSPGPPSLPVRKRDLDGTWLTSSVALGATAPCRPHRPGPGGEGEGQRQLRGLGQPGSWGSLHASPSPPARGGPHPSLLPALRAGAITLQVVQVILLKTNLGHKTQPQHRQQYRENITKGCINVKGRYCPSIPSLTDWPPGTCLAT